MNRIASFNDKILNFLNVCGPYVIMRSVNFRTVLNIIHYATLLKRFDKYLKTIKSLFCNKTISSHAYLIKIATVVFFTGKLF